MSSSNPFDKDGGLPSVSFGGKDPNTGQITSKPVGYEVHVRVTKAPTLVQSREYGGTKLLFWDPNNKGKKVTEPNDQPCMSVVFHGNIEFDSEGKDIGVEKAQWVQKPSALFTAVGDAINDAKVDGITVGCLVKTKMTGFKQGEDQSRAAAKQYEVVVVPPNGFASEVPAAPAAATPPPPAPPAAAAPPPPPAPPAPVSVPTTPEGYTLASLVAAGWTSEQAVAAYPVLAAPAAAPATPAPPVAPAADAGPVETADEKRAKAMANLSDEDKKLLGL